MTGLRVGYLITPSSSSSAAAKVQEPLISCVNTPAQLAALAALEGSQDDARTMVDAYRSNREAAMSSLESLGIPYLIPHGAFYIWADLRNRVGSLIADWALRLLREKMLPLHRDQRSGSRARGG